MSEELDRASHDYWTAQTREQERDAYIRILRAGGKPGYDETPEQLAALGVKPAEVVPLFGGADERCETLRAALLDLIYERCSGMPVPLILGVLRLVEHDIIREHT